MSSINELQAYEEDLVSDERYEIKIPFPSVQTPEVMAWIRLHPEQWRVSYPPRQVNNIYFDTLTFTNLNANLDGNYERSKLRIRWYGKIIDRLKNAQFEIKHKQGLIGWKRILAIPGTLQLTKHNWHHIMALLKSRMKVASILFQRYPVPTIINSYNRRYYTSPDKKLRLTVDTNLLAYDQQTSLRPNIQCLSLPQPYTIVEIKTHPDNVERLSHVLSHSTSRVTRFSKYVHAVLASPSL